MLTSDKAEFKTERKLLHRLKVETDVGKVVIDHQLGKTWLSCLFTFGCRGREEFGKEEKYFLNLYMVNLVQPTYYDI